MRVLAAFIFSLLSPACGLEAIPPEVEGEKSSERCANENYIVVERYESYYGDREYYCVPKPPDQGED